MLLFGDQLVDEHDAVAACEEVLDFAPCIHCGSIALAARVIARLAVRYRREGALIVATPLHTRSYSFGQAASSCSAP